MERYRPGHSQPHISDVNLGAISRVLAAQPDVELAYLLGSAARGQARADSDLDIYEENFFIHRTVERIRD